MALPAQTGRPKVSGAKQSCQRRRHLHDVEQRRRHAASRSCHCWSQAQPRHHTKPASETISAASWLSKEMLIRRCRRRAAPSLTPSNLAAASAISLCVPCRREDVYARPVPSAAGQRLVAGVLQRLVVVLGKEKCGHPSTPVFFNFGDKLPGGELTLTPDLRPDGSSVFTHFEARRGIDAVIARASSPRSASSSLSAGCSAARHSVTRLIQPQIDRRWPALELDGPQATINLSRDPHTSPSTSKLDAKRPAASPSAPPASGWWYCNRRRSPACP